MEHQFKAACFPCVVHYLNMKKIIEIVFQTKVDMLPNSGSATHSSKANNLRGECQ